MPISFFYEEQINKIPRQSHLNQHQCGQKHRLAHSNEITAINLTNKHFNKLKINNLILRIFLRGVLKIRFFKTYEIEKAQFTDCK